MDIAGAQDGDVIIGLSDFTFKCFAPEHEALLAEENLRLISLARPGFGQTTPACGGVPYNDCVAGDIEAVLDQCGVKSAVLFAQGTSFVTALRVAAIVPSRISRIVTTYLAGPLPYKFGFEGDRSYFSSTNDLLVSTSFIRRVMIRAAARSFSTLGAEGAMRAVYTRRYDTIMKDMPASFMVELDGAMQSATTQGLGPICYDYEEALSDWRSDLKTCPVPIVSFREAEAISMSDASYDAYAVDFADKVTTIRQPSPGPVGAGLVGLFKASSL